MSQVELAKNFDLNDVIDRYEWASVSFHQDGAAIVKFMKKSQDYIVDNSDLIISNMWN